MLTEDLFRSVLIEPATSGADKLMIVSGFATANMADRHMEHLKKLEAGISISLIVGMAKQGIDKIQHRGFQELMRQEDKRFCCHYLVESNLCHSKVFIWQKNKQPIKAFVGSANYTLTGFGRSQLESVTEADPILAQRYFDSLYPLCSPCIYGDIENTIRIIEPKKVKQYDDEDIAILSLVVCKTDKIHERSGLNWGQREGREKNQAYIPIPKEVRDKNFFPPIGEQFTALTDDDESFILVVAQERGKALHSTENNSLLGLYFRNRMGLPSGSFITRQNLVQYGRLDVSFYRIDSDTYYMDFSPNFEAGDDAELWEK